MPYEIIGRIGRGGMGVVDLATDPEGREVALKRLSLHGTPDELARALDVEPQSLIEPTPDDQD